MCFAQGQFALVRIVQRWNQWSASPRRHMALPKLEYRAMQDTEMQKLITLLRADAPDAQLVKISFLGYS
jgi:hypothetical protein